MNKINNIFKICGIFLIAAIAGITGCNDPLITGAHSAAPGKGMVQLNIDGSGARTVKPDTSAFTYDLSFTAAGKTSVNKTLSSLTNPVEVEVGTWTLTVTAKSGANAVGRATASDVVIAEGETTSVSVQIVPLSGDTVANGTFTWETDFDDTLISSAKLTVSKLDGSGKQEIELDDDQASGSMYLAPGSWLARAVLVSKDNPDYKAAYTEIVHIYSGVRTTLNWEFADVYFIASKDVNISVTINTGAKTEITGVTVQADGHRFHGDPMTQSGGVWTLSDLVPLEDTQLFAHLVITTASGSTITTTAETVSITGETATMGEKTLVAVYGAIGKGGKVTINGADKTGSFQIDMLKDTPVTVTATADENYALVTGSLKIGGQNATLTAYAVSADAAVEAEFKASKVLPGDSDPLAGKLLVFQAYGGNGATDGAVDNSFVELYNTTGDEIPLEGMSLYFANVGVSGATEDLPWSLITFTSAHKIPSKGSFLIVGLRHSSSVSKLKVNGTGDINDNALSLSNRGFKVALLRNTLPLSEQNPFTMDGAGIADGYIDMVGAKNDDSDMIHGYETKYVRNSKQKSVRRIRPADTNNNAIDFVQVDYRADRITDNGFARKKPRKSTDGAWDAEPIDTGTTLLIWQAGTLNPTSMGAISHSFVELYNAGETTVDLTGYALWWASGTSSASGSDSAWTKINLSGTIPPHHSFLIRGNGGTATGGQPNTGIPNPDLNAGNTFNMSNNAFKVLLMSNQNGTSASLGVNPSINRPDGYIDMLGAQNPPGTIRGYEGDVMGKISKQQTARRTSLLDTDNNADDFINIDYRSSGVPVEHCVPKNLSRGAWNPVTGDDWD